MKKALDIVCVILAGGRGKRMGVGDCHKVCFPVAGKPAIVRAIDTYKEAGIRRFLVVVGQMADQVVHVVSEAHPETLFVCQTNPRGTGHAAAVAVEALAAQGHKGEVMVVMGDKVISGSCVRRLVETFSESRPDMLVSTLAKLKETTAGRVVEGDDGDVLGIVECADILQAAAQSSMIKVGGREFSAAEVEERGLTVNASLYLFKMPALHVALRQLEPSNAQNELYLTDTVEILSREGKRVERMLVPDPNDLMGFNTPAELLAIEKMLREKEGIPLVSIDPGEVLGKGQYKPAKRWLAELAEFSEDMRVGFVHLYGDDESVIADRREAMTRVVAAFMGQYGPDRKMVICRAPGRVNLMGRHVDHRGGFVNVMAINRETLVAAAPREDDLVRLRDVRVNRFANREFRIYDLLGEDTWDNWLSFLESKTVARVLEATPGDWVHYVRAPLLRLQYEHQDRRLKGMDCMVCGNIPLAAGLSSSSALVVAFAAVTAALNGIKIEMDNFVDLCGEGEWFVGSRGGAADHAAIRAGKLGQVTRIGFFPFSILGTTDLPADLRVVIANSGFAACKSGAARDTFNHRVATYEAALLLLKRSWPAAAGAEYLRDLVPENLEVQPRDFYTALKHLPEFPDRETLRELLRDEDPELVERIFASHADVGPYNLRGCALFGVAECARSAKFADILASGDLERVGEFMRASHDGDRVVYKRGDQLENYCFGTGDASLDKLAAANAPLALQPGSYACSTPEIDEMVEIALATEGVVGAQLAGAGLGGCMMTLVKVDALETLCERFRSLYYEPRELCPEMNVCLPVAGACLLESKMEAAADE